MIFWKFTKKKSTAIWMVTIVIFVLWYALEGRRWSYLENLPEGEELAKYLIAHGRPLGDCYKTYQFFTSYPPLSEAREYCVKNYAKLARDPSVCEPLMPSQSGWSCVGLALEREPCVFGANAQNTVSGNGINTTLNKCINGPENVRLHECCLIARISFQPNNAETCDSLIKAPALSDQCHHEVALKTKDSATCNLIQSQNIRSACKVQVKALKMEPSG